MGNLIKHKSNFHRVTPSINVYQCCKQKNSLSNVPVVLYLILDVWQHLLLQLRQRSSDVLLGMKSTF